MIKRGGWNKGKLLNTFCPKGHNKDVVGRNTQGNCNQCVKDRDVDPIFKMQKKNARFIRLYGISLDDYNKMLNKQNNRCAICFKPRKLVVDHNHYTNKVRGLLCGPCNLILGSIRDNVGILDMAVKYLEVNNGY